MKDERDLAQTPGSDRYDCLIVSDLHLGSDLCQAALLERFLEWAVDHTRELIINGDIFDDLNFKRLSKRHFACLKVIRRHSDRTDLRIVWVRGNHDGPADVVGHIVGVQVLDEYVFSNDQIRLLVLHGDQFDRLVSQHGLLTEIACGAFYYIQKWAPHHAARYIRRISKRWQRSSLRIRDGAVAYARSKGYRHVTCGHTHVSGVEQVGDVTYFNTGTWTEDPPCPFVAIKGDQIVLRQWAEITVEPPASHPVELTPTPAQEPMTADLEIDSGNFDHPPQPSETVDESGSTCRQAMELSVGNRDAS